MSGINKYYNVVNNKSHSLRIISEWYPDHLDLKIMKGEQALSAHVTMLHLQNFAQLYECSLDDYVCKLRQYICSEQPGTSLCVVEENKETQLVIKRTSGKITKKVFITTLNKISYQNCVESLLDYFNQECSRLKCESGLLIQQKIQAENEKLVSVNKLEEFLDMKQKAEKKLYSSFLLLLNEKKHRIQYLNEVLENRDNIQTIHNGNLKTEPSVENVSEDSDNSESDEKETSIMEKVALQQQSQKRLKYFDDIEPAVSTLALPKRVRTTVLDVAVDTSKQQGSSKAPDEFVTEVVPSDSDGYEMNTQEMMDRL